MIILVKALLFLGAGVFNALMDTLLFHYSTSIFPKGEQRLLGKGEHFWNPKYSSEKKTALKTNTSGFFFAPCWYSPQIPGISSSS